MGSRVRRDLARLIALTVWQPWATLLACGVKLVENRTWAPRAEELRPGETFLVHAGRFGVRHDEVEPAAEEWEAARELLVAHCRAGGVCPDPVKRLFRRRTDGTIAGTVEVSYGALVALVTFDGVTRSARRVEGARDPWWCGPVGWYVRDPVRFPPLPCAGEAGLWVVAPDVERVVRERLCAVEDCDG